MNLLTDEEGRLAVERARELVESVVQRKPVADISYPPVFETPRGVFVTLTEFGDLRGCIGIPYPVMPLAEALEDAAVSASVRDPRFQPVGPDELADIAVEVTILTPPEELTCPPPERWQHTQPDLHQSRTPPLRLAGKNLHRPHLRRPDLLRTPVDKRQPSSISKAYTTLSMTAHGASVKNMMSLMASRIDAIAQMIATGEIDAFLN